MLGAAASPAQRRALALGLGQRLCGDLGAADGWSALALLPATGMEEDERDLQAEALGRYGSGWVAFATFMATELIAVRGVTGASAYRRGLGTRAYHSLVLAPFGRLGGHQFVLRPEGVRAWLLATFPEAEARDVLAGFDAAAGSR
jgi:hypothetical protein